MRREADKLWEYLSAKALGHTYKPTVEKPSVVEESPVKQQEQPIEQKPLEQQEKPEEPKEENKPGAPATYTSYMWMNEEDTAVAIRFAIGLCRLLFAGKDVSVSSEGEGISLKGEFSLEEVKKFFQIVSLHIEND